MLLASDYRGLGELGAVCGLGLAVALIQVLLVVPAALTIAGPEQRPVPSWWRHIARWQMHRPRQALLALTLSLLGIIAIAATHERWIVFDSNPRNLRPADDAVFSQQINLMRELGLVKSGHQILIRAEQSQDALAAAAIIGERAPEAAPWSTLLAPIDNATT